MPAYILDQVSNEKLLTELGALIAADRMTVALLLAHLAEVDARMLYRPLAYSTMHEYCVDALHMSDDAAYKRCRAARAARRFPQLFDAIADGRLHVSGVAVLAPHLTDDNVDALIVEATHRRKVDIETIVARLAPRPDVPDAVLPLGIEPQSATQSAQATIDATPPPARVQPLAPERFGLHMTIGQETRDKLERAKALMRHRNPSGDLAVIIDAALDALLTRLEKQKFAVTDRPRTAKPQPATPRDADPSYIPAEVRRAVYERDRGQCTFHSADGRRCTEEGFLEFDHTTMVCRGGQPTIEGLRLRCRAHNQHAAEEALGAAFMKDKREAAARDRDVVRALRGMGFKADETSRAMSNTAHLAAGSIEQRLRTALAELTRIHGNRCSDAGLDAAAPPSALAAPWTTAFARPPYTHAASPRRHQA